MNTSKIKQWESDIEKISSYWRDKVKEHGFSPASLGEREEIKDKKFFDGLFENLEIGNNLSVLDIGSGMGDIITYLEHDKNINIVDYLGIDLLEEFIGYTRKKYPGREFQIANFISDSFQLSKKFDLVIAMGVLVSRVSDYNDFVEYFISKALKFTKKFFVFNLIVEIDPSSPNYEHQEVIGGITYIPESILIDKLDKLKAANMFTYDVNKKRIYEDATDAFVRIKIEN